MLTTKRQFRKTDGRQFYHFVQSFSDEDRLTPREANAIGLEFAAQEFPDFEVVIATRLDTGHLHNHFGFYPGTEEPEEGWLGELASDAVRLASYLEQATDAPDLPPIPTWSESKQRSREALKKLAHGQKLSNEPSYGYDFQW